MSGPALAAPSIAQVGTVASEVKISATAGGFSGDLSNCACHISPVSALGDVDGDGVGDLAVGAPMDSDGSMAGMSAKGAVWILFLNVDGTVRSEQKISATAGGFGGVLDFNDFFGSSVAALGDLDGDGTGDLAVGAKGAMWILFLNTDGTVKSEQKITESVGGFNGDLALDDRFGAAASAIGDLDGDGITDLAVGAYQDGDGGGQHGAVWILFLNADGTVKSEQKISDTAGGFGGVGAALGRSVSLLDDLNDDGTRELAVGAFHQDGSRGAVWILFINPDGTVQTEQNIATGVGGFEGSLDPGDFFGWAVAGVDDLDGDGVGDLVVGAAYDDDGGADRGAMWVLFLNANGTVRSEQKISAIAGGFGGHLDDRDHFGAGVVSLGDHDGDGVADLVVGAEWDDDGGASTSSNKGALWVLFLAPDGPFTTVTPGSPCALSLAPTLSGAGTLDPLSSNSLALAGAAPGAACFLVAGFEFLDLPWMGGTFGPAAHVVVPIGLDVSGGATVPFAWPAVPAGTNAWVQFWCLDPPPFATNKCSSNTLKLTGS